MAAEEIELFAHLRLGATKDGNKWRVFDKSKLEFLQPTLATPHLCTCTESPALVLNRLEDGGAVGDRRGAL